MSAQTAISQGELREFLQRACHDLRSPARAVRTNAELLQRAREKREGPEYEEVLGYLVSGAAKVHELVDAIGAYAAALEVRRNTKAVSAGMLLRSAMAKLEPLISSTRARIEYGDLPQVTGDHDRLIQLFEHLLRNSMEHRGDADPCIEIASTDKGSEVVFQVKDNGPGVDPEDLERIFRPFERLQRDRGTAGLGLAICRAVVNGHGGRIWAEPAPGSGLTICFSLPA